MGTSQQQVERGFEAIVASLRIPQPWNFTEFAINLGIDSGRPIELIPVTTEPGKPCGLLVSTERADYICYAANMTPLHQLHIQCHEIAHLLRGHTGTAAIDTQLTQLLMPSLPASVIERVLGRTTYTAQEEHDAELLGSLIMRRIGRHSEVRREVRPAAAATLARLAGVFDVQPGVRHD
ncbi:MAG TPA: hypothetical protein VFW65_11255 [Pseudonocardiaceae bacterium]|nr:hypothetical protein [Pseudonocardiaceae bacterium]